MKSAAIAVFGMVVMFFIGFHKDQQVVPASSEAHPIQYSIHLPEGTNWMEYILPTDYRDMEMFFQWEADCGQYHKLKVTGQ